MIDSIERERERGSIFTWEEWIHRHPFNVFTRMSGMVYTGNKHWKYR